MKHGQHLARLAALLSLWWLSCGPASAQNHPELEWQVLETEHFRVLYHQGLEQVAARVAGMAEDAYGPITELYGYEPPGPVPAQREWSCVR